MTIEFDGVVPVVDEISIATILEPKTTEGGIKVNSSTTHDLSEQQLSSTSLAKEPTSESGTIITKTNVDSTACFTLSTENVRNNLTPI
jgi:hypothetical protein